MSILCLAHFEVCRQWAVYLLGVGKIAWSLKGNRPGIKILRAKKLVLDEEAIVDEDGYNGRFIGEKKTAQASVLVKQFPKKATDIKEKVKDEKLTTSLPAQRLQKP